MIKREINKFDIERYMEALKDIGDKDRIEINLMNRELLEVVEAIGIRVDEFKEEVAKRVEDYIIKRLSKEPREILIECIYQDNRYVEYRDIVKEVVKLIKKTDGTAESIYEVLKRYYEYEIEPKESKGANWTYKMAWKDVCAIRGKTNLQLNKDYIIKEMKREWDIG